MHHTIKPESRLIVEAQDVKMLGPGHNCTRTLRLREMQYHLSPKPTLSCLEVVLKRKTVGLIKRSVSYVGPGSLLSGTNGCWAFFLLPPPPPTDVHSV